MYGEGRYFNLVRCKSNEEWLEQRKHGIGGSDVGAVMGLSPWKTPLDVWLEKTGRSEPEDISSKPYVAFGNVMEPMVGEWFKSQHPDRIVRRVNAICQGIEHPWMQASLDYEQKSDAGWGVLEIKTARSKSDWELGIPVTYFCQVNFYLLVTHRSYADVAVFFRDSCEYAEYYVERDEDDIRAVTEAATDFWENYVVRDVMPQVVGADAPTLAGLIPQDADELATPADMEEADRLIAAYQQARERERESKAEAEDAQAKLCAIIGGAKGIETDTARVTWTRGERRRFDSKRFRAENAELYDQYQTTGTYQQFKVKEI